MSNSFVTPGIVAHHAPLSMGFSRQEYWSGLPCPPPGDLPEPGKEPASFMCLALAGRIFTTSPTWEAPHRNIHIDNYLKCNHLHPLKCPNQKTQTDWMDTKIRSMYTLPTRDALHGEGNGNPLQYSCLENPVARGAWWAAVHRVA